MTSAAVKRSTTAPANRRNLLIVGGVIVVVLVVAVIAIALSGNQSGDVNMDAIPQSRGTDGSFILGDPDAPITIVEFADFACPHCQEYHGEVTRFLKDYVATGKAKFEYRVYPTAGGALSLYTGQLLECAENQKAGSFWRAYNLMFDYAFSGRYNQDVGRLLATDEGLNYSQLLTCAETATQVNVDANYGQNAGITGTPAVLVRYGNGPADFVNYNGRTYSSGGPPYSVLAALADAAQ
ncbi:MAG: thioredoxin domain-containing protein [Anaerolineae bacterium]|nr:thioredoxin domain-containing protein [Anaerolineae bacterium]